jgi:hypothetical protein
MGTQRHRLEIRESYFVQVSDWQTSLKVPLLLWMARSGTIICDGVHHRDERWLSLFCGLWKALDFVPSGRTLEETAALFDGVKVPRNPLERKNTMTFARIPQYPRPPGLDQDTPDNYFELFESNSVRSSALVSPSHIELQEPSRVSSVFGSPLDLETQSEESAITFFK